MASNINDTGVNSEFPIAGQDNDSQGFRDNFTTIKSNFVAAKSEITTLQTTTAQGVSYTAGANDQPNVNDFNASTLQNANLENITETAFVPGSVVNTSQNVNLNNGAHQEFTVGADITLTLSSWSTVTKKTGKVRVYVKSDQSAGSATNRIITFGSNAGGGTLKRSSNWPNGSGPANSAIISPPSGSEAKYFVFEFVSYDSGNTVWANYLGEFV